MRRKDFVRSCVAIAWVVTRAASASTDDLLIRYLVAHPNTHVTFNVPGGVVREMVAQIHNDGSLQITTGIREGRGWC